MSSITIIGSIAGSLTTISFLPQLIKVYKTKSAHDISFAMFAIFTTGVALWIVYGLMLSAIPIIATNIVTLTLAGSILVLKIKYRDPAAQRQEKLK